MKFDDAVKYLKLFVSYEDILKYKYNEEFFDLERFKRFLKDYGVKYDALRCVHVAGSKGKGTTSNLIANYLTKGGKSVGLFTSPYIFDITECFVIDGKKISRADFVKRVVRVREFLNEWIDEDKGRYVTYFEILFALVLEYFIENDVDFAVMEVGLGGRLDATNVISPILTVLTRIEKEHTEILGHTYEKILNEKLGIVKKYNIENHIPLVVAPQNKFVLKEIKKRHLNVPVFYVEGGVLDVNYATALTSLLALSLRKIVGGVDVSMFEKVFNNLKITGRFNIKVVNKCSVVFDMAHTQESAKYLVNNLRAKFPNKKFVVLISMMKNKNVKGFLKEMSKLNVSEFIFTTSHGVRGRSGKELSKAYLGLGKAKTVVIENSLKAFKKAILDTKKWDQVLVVTGSHFLIQIVG